MLSKFSGLVCCIFAIMICVGCETDNNGDNDNENGNDHDHNGHHEHAPHGSRGGHISVFKSDGGKEVMIEHVEKDGANLVEFYTVEGKEKNYELRPLAIEKFVVFSKKGSKEQSFDLMAVEPQDGKASKFEAIDKNLIVAMDLGVEASFTMDGEEYKATIHPSGH